MSCPCSPLRRYVRHERLHMPQRAQGRETYASLCVVLHDFADWAAGIICMICRVLHRVVSMNLMLGPSLVPGAACRSGLTRICNPKRPRASRLGSPRAGQRCPACVAALERVCVGGGGGTVGMIVIATGDHSAGGRAWPPLSPWKACPLRLPAAEATSGAPLGDMYTGGASFRGKIPSSGNLANPPPPEIPPAT